MLRSQIKNLWGDIGVSKAWLKCYEPLDRALLDDAIGVLADSGIESSDGSHSESGLGLVLLGDLSTELIDWLERASRRTTVLAIALTETGLTVDQTWQLMNAGAADVILWRRVPSSAEDVLARIDRVHQVTAFMRSPTR